MEEDKTRQLSYTRVPNHLTTVLRDTFEISVYLLSLDCRKQRVAKVLEVQEEILENVEEDPELSTSR